MGNNSIRSNLSKEDMISDINLMRGASSSSQTAFLVVEGRDDIIFFQNRILHDINLYESFCGCEGVKEIIEFFSADNVIGICDRDYDTAYTNQRLFFYDHNCLEMMLISSDAAFNSVCTTCYAGVLSFTDLRLQILKDLKLISILRKINSDSKMGINFKRMSISDLYSKQQQIINIAKIKNSIQSNIMVKKRFEIAKLRPQIVTYEHLLQITNGHDFLCYLQLLFEANKPPKCRSANVDMIFVFLSIAFREDDFKSTVIYQDLKQFELLHHLTILK